MAYKETWAYLPLLLVLLVGLLAIVGILNRSGTITGLTVGRTNLEQPVRPQTLSVRPPCNESDRGYDWYIAGTTWYEGSSSHQPKSDRCVRPYVLQEYYCYNNQRMSRTITCPVGYRCETGACMTDGKVPYTIRNDEYRERLAKRAQGSQGPQGEVTIRA